MGRGGSWTRGAKGRAGSCRSEEWLDGTKEQVPPSLPQFGLAFPGDSP